MLCHDPLMQYLNSLGYSVIRHPRKDIEVMTVIYGSRRGMKVLNTLKELVDSDQKMPSIKHNIPAANLNNKVTGKISGSLGSDIVNKCLAGMGLTANAGISVEDTHKMQLKFDHVTIDTVQNGDIMPWLVTGTATNVFHANRSLVKGKKLYLITETIQSNAISITTSDNTGAKVDLDVALLKKELAKAGIAISQNEKDGISFTGAHHLKFGFKALQLVPVKGDDGLIRFELYDSSTPAPQIKGLVHPAPSSYVAANALVDLS